MACWLQSPLPAMWGAHLQQHSALFTSPLSGEVKCLLGPVTYISERQKEPALESLVAESHYRKGRTPIFEDVWCQKGQPSLIYVSKCPRPCLLNRVWGLLQLVFAARCYSGSQTLDSTIPAWFALSVGQGRQQCV